MSRIGKKSIIIPTGVTITPKDHQLTVKGAKGELTLQLMPYISVQVKAPENTVHVAVTNPEDITQKAMWGTTTALIQNMVMGVSVGFSKKLAINGVGYEWKVNGQKLTIKVGYSHPVEVILPKGIAAEVGEKNILNITGIDKQLVGETAARIRQIRSPEPYKGKGIKYVDEQIRRKAGKQAASAAA